MTQVIAGGFAAYGSAVAGDPNYGSAIYTNRCVAWRAVMVAGGVVASA